MNKRVLSNILDTLSIILGFVFMMSIFCESDTIKGIIIQGVILITSLLGALLLHVLAEKLRDKMF